MESLLYERLSSRMVEGGRKRTRREQRHTKLLEFVTLAAQVCLTLAAFIIIAMRNDVHTSEWGLRQRAGFIVFVPAFCAWVAARVELSKYSSFAVMPAIPPKLVQTGCYSYLQHPIYVTSFLYVLAYFLVISSIRGCLALLILAPVQYMRASVESINLKKKFHYKYELFIEAQDARYRKSGARTVVLCAFTMLAVGTAHLLMEEWPVDPWDLFDMYPSEE